MRLVHCSCPGLHRVCAPARTSGNGEYCHFWRNLGAPVDHLLRRGCAEAAPRLRQLRQVRRYFPAYPQRDSPGAGFQHVEYLHVSSARRNRAHTAQPTQLVMDERICHRRFIIENYSRGKSTMGPLCNQASPIPHKWRICGYVRTSTQPRRLSGRAHDFCDYAQATTLAVD